MDIQRLKFAWARGARIQYQRVHTEVWITSKPSWYEDSSYRIHPDDEHLQYGPLSGWMREYAIDDPAGGPRSLLERAALDLFAGTWASEMPLFEFTDRQECLMAVLFFAELLADEGL